MDESTIVGQLEELAHSLAIQVRYEPIKKEGTFFAGGLCQLKGKHLLIINSNATMEDKIQALAKAVNRFDLSQVYLRPGIRDLLDNFSE